MSVSNIDVVLSIFDRLRKKENLGYKNKSPINLLLKHSQLSGTVPIPLTKTQLNAIERF